MPFIPIIIVAVVGGVVARVVYKARKRDRKFIEAVQASMRG